jgi:hypothetical protein
MASEDLASWATRIYDSLPESGITTTGKIFNWLTSNPHKLNGAFHTSYFYNGSGIEPTLTPNHSGIYEEFYRCSLWRDQVVRFIGANAFDMDLTETSLEGQSRHRFVSRNERAKTYRLEAKDCEERLNLLIKDIEDADSTGPMAAQILFYDRQNMVYGDNRYCPPREYFSQNNTVFSKFYTFS